MYQVKENRMWKQHVSYIKSRGFDYEDMCRFRIGVSSEFEFKDRIIFPSFDVDQNLNYYIARSINKEAYRKYKNCKASFKKK